ncbi:MAG: MFS transporter [Candidatus Moduliflexus flocculans]|nr:MFS transporter [Candidatus Moduliflexus flocculans]
MGRSTTYYINAVSFLAVIVGPDPDRATLPQDAPSCVKPASAWRADPRGIRFILNKPIILSTMLLDFVATFFASANTHACPSSPRDILQGRRDRIRAGYLPRNRSGRCWPALVISQIPGIRKQGPIFLGAVVDFRPGNDRFWAVSSSFVPGHGALWSVIGAADPVSTIIRNTIRQLQTPDHIRGRMTSVNQIFFQGGPQLGEVEAGVVAQLFGAPFAIVSGGIACILGMTLIVRKWPALLTFNGDEPSLAGATAD